MAGFADDGDGVGGDEYQYWGVGVGDADAEVVESAAVAQGEFAELVDDVVADAELAVGVGGGVGLRAGRCRPVRVSWPRRLLSPVSRALSQARQYLGSLASSSGVWRHAR